MKVQAVWAVKVPPDEEAEDLHEFFLYWYRFAENRSDIEPSLRPSAKPAIWIRFGRASHLERIRDGFPEAKLGPGASFNEALIFAEEWAGALTLKEKVSNLLGEEEGNDEMSDVIKEDTMEDI